MTVRVADSAKVTFRSQRPADQIMRRLLGIHEPATAGDGHRTFRISVVTSGIRCLITYLLVPILVPALSLAGWVAAPIGIGLCLVAAVTGILSVRRFWRSDHRHRWLYTAFIGVVFVFLAVALVSDLQRWGVIT